MARQSFQLGRKCPNSLEIKGIQNRQKQMYKLKQTKIMASCESGHHANYRAKALNVSIYGKWQGRVCRMLYHILHTVFVHFSMPFLVYPTQCRRVWPSIGR